MGLPNSQPTNVFYVNPNASADPTILGSSSFTATSILNNIFATILKVTNSMQSVTAAEAGRIQLLTSWTTAYTSKMNQLENFTVANVPTGITTTNLNTLNNSNSGFLTSLQNRQGVLNNTSKALQSNVDQSNSAVNTQSTQGTTIIQELSTLLGSTFSG